ncbi:MAG: acyltransferase [Myxococcales bacterium]|nr:acyltransferase [Myxococcales bacterium]
MFSAYTTARGEAAGAFSPVQRWLFNLWSGVDVFFVLSGFLIGRILLGNLARTGRIGWASFLVRRSLRIFPAYYVVLAAALLVVAPHAPRAFAFLFETRDFGALRAAAWPAFLYVANYWTPPGAPSPMSWAWSLCIEEHFYLVLPPLLWLFVRGRGRAAHAAVLALGLLGPFAARAAVFAADPGSSVRAVYFQSHFRFDELFAGVAVAYAHVHFPDALRRLVARAGLWLPAAGAGAIASVWAFGSPHAGGAFRLLFQFPLLAFGTAALVAHVLHATSPVSRALAARALAPIARVSYGMYLVHPYVLFAWMSGPFSAMFRAPRMGPWVAALAAACALASWALAAAMFVALERPLLDLGARLAARVDRRRLAASPT